MWFSTFKLGETNLFACFFNALTLFCTSIYVFSLLNSSDCFLKFIKPLLLYGKLNITKNKKQHEQRSFFSSQYFQIHKKNFLHFYVYATVMQLALFFYYFKFCSTKEDYFSNFIRIIFGNNSNCEKLNHNLVLFATFLITLHFARRAYECKYISIFSNSTIFIVHYFIGFYFYTSILLVEANLLICSFSCNEPFSVFSSVLGTIIFVLGMLIQHETMKRFAFLRLNKKNSTNLREQHYIPHGYLFNYITSPHYFGEILIYLGLLLVLNFNVNIIYILFWVISISVYTAIVSHKWYHNYFENNYPEKRKIIIPFIF